MPGHSRPKDGVASLAYARASTPFVLDAKTWITGGPVMTKSG
jgi:hypothetical protein